MFQENDVIVIKSLSKEEDAALYLVISIMGNPDGQIRCVRVTRNKRDEVFSEFMKDVNDVEIARKCEEIFMKVWGKHWYYDLHEQVSLYENQIELRRRP